MAFIDIFNFKKYITKQSDAQVARYGHVNAAVEFGQQELALFATNIAVNQFADNAAALAGGLQVGELYSTTGAGAAPLNVPGIVMVVV